MLFLCTINWQKIYTFYLFLNLAILPLLINFAFKVTRLPKLLNIPVEDIFYGFELIVLNVFLYEYLKTKK